MLAVLCNFLGNFFEFQYSCYPQITIPIQVIEIISTVILKVTLRLKPLGDDIGIYEYEQAAFVHSSSKLQKREQGF